MPTTAVAACRSRAHRGSPRRGAEAHPRLPRDSTRQYLATWNDGQPARFEDTLSQTRFGGSRTVYAPGRPDLIRDIDTVVANYFSLSYAAPRWFGNRRADFESDLRHLLRSTRQTVSSGTGQVTPKLVIATKS